MLTAPLGFVHCLISAGGAPLSVLKDYIENQKTPE
jgi:hypothetical protein